MDRFLDPYFVVDFILMVLMFIGGIALLSYAIPPDPKLKYYRTSRYILCCGYFLWAFMIMWQIIVADYTGDHISHIAMSVTSAVASFIQVTIFAYSLILLLKNSPVSLRSVLLQFVPLVIVSCAMTAAILWSPERDYVFNFLWCSYLLVFFLNIALFVREYLLSLKKTGGKRNKAERRRIKWVGRLSGFFFIIVSIGIVMAPLDIPKQYYMIFGLVDIMFYAYFFIRYINYVSLFRDQVAAPAAQQRTYGSGLETVAAKVDEWVAGKGYLQQGVTLQSLSGELKTNQTYLSRYINETMGMAFKQWISTLRITESKELMADFPAKPVSEIAAMSGIPNRSSFCRQFQNITGATPGEYRKTLQAK